MRLKYPLSGYGKYSPTSTPLHNGIHLFEFGQLWIPGLFTDEQMFIIKSLEQNRVRFIQAEKFTGLPVPLVDSILDNTRKGFDEMSKALKSKQKETPIASYELILIF